jgi:hypothetical protein
MVHESLLATERHAGENAAVGHRGTMGAEAVGAEVERSSEQPAAAVEARATDPAPVLDFGPGAAEGSGAAVPAAVPEAAGRSAAVQTPEPEPRPPVLVLPRAAGSDARKVREVSRFHAVRGTATVREGDGRCQGIVTKIQLGGALTDDERSYMRTGCAPDG